MKKALKYTLCTLKWLIIGIMGLLVLSVALIYVPPVQDFIVRKVLDSVNSGGEMHISAGHLRLRFPLELEADSLRMQSAGMDISAARAEADIAVLPFIKGNAVVKELSLGDAVVNIGTPDSSLYMLSRLHDARVADVTVGLISKRINVESLTASDGDISITITPDTVPEHKKESAPADWVIDLAEVRLTKIGYGMRMLPAIDILRCSVGEAAMKAGVINLRNSTVNVESLSIDNVDATYIVPAPGSADAKPVPALPADTTSSTPWSIAAERLRLTGSHALYATRGVLSTENFNPQRIEVSQIEIAVDSFRNRGTEICVPLKKLSAREHCGIALEASGIFAMDSVAIHAKGFKISTPASAISLDATMGLDTVNPPLSLLLEASLSPDDIRRLVPAASGPIAAALPHAPLLVDIDLEGRMNSLDIRRVSAKIPRHISVEASGKIADYSDITRAIGDISIKGTVTNGNFIKPALLDAKMSRQVNVPPLRVSGAARLRRGVIDGNLRAVTDSGKVLLDAHWNNSAEAYDVKLNLQSFPIQAILPESGARDLSASIDLKGAGLDFFSPKTNADASVVLDHMNFRGRNYNNITLSANLAGGKASVDAQSDNRNARFNLKAAGNLAGDTLDWTVAGNIRNIDLYALALADTTSDGSVKFSGKASLCPPVPPTRRSKGRPMLLRAEADIADIYWHVPGEAVNADNIALTFATDTAHTTATLNNHDLTLRFSSPIPLDSLTEHFTWTAQALDRDMKRRRLAIDTLQRALPPFGLTLRAGGDNILANYLLGSDLSFNRITLDAANDSLLTLSALADGIRSGKTKIDTITAAMRQRGEYLLYDIAMHNRPGTLDQFAHADVRGYINADRLSLIFKQQNLQGETGYSLGAMARFLDTDRLELRFVPYHPVIGYKDWEVNKDNVISYNLGTGHLDANLDLSNDVSSVHLYTEHQPNDSTQEDIILKIKDIKLSDWMALNPFAPPVTGDLSADMRVSWHKPDLNGNGTVSLTGFNYGKKKVGDFELAVDIVTNTAGTIRANTSLMVNGVKSITASGNLNDSTAEHPFLLDFRMIRFPLSVVNPFLPPGTATLSGMLNGQMDITGEMTSPVFNGFLNFDSTTVRVDMLGTPFRFSGTKIPVENNLVTFTDFSIAGVNDNPLRINGTVDIASLASPKFDLTLNADNMQIVGSSKKRKSQVYGKAFIDLDAKVKGSMQFMSVNAALNLLPGSNVTYVMADAATQLASRSNQDMVTFVNFSDTAAVEMADTVAAPSMLMNLDARLTISTGTTITAELDPQGNSKVQLQSSGTMNYTMDYMDDERFTGRINISNGFVRYAIPVIGEKSFTFREGSYVEFNGDMLNPILHVMAYDQIRANVAQGGGDNSRVVNFDVELNVTGTLEEMNVVFDLSCPDDITVANELKAMNAEQRANQAMNLLLYNTYRAGGTQTISSGNVGTNALFNFLESQLNTWASSAIKGVDISFGINQYDKTVDGANTTAMNYSYRVSKSLFDDRFKIVVGGNYTTDAEADENFAQNLIADISFEYMLNKAGTMYVRLFRHTGYESILEGEITQTGVGFVYKKKIGRISDIFRFMRRGHGDTPAAATPPPAPLSDPAPGKRPVPKSDIKAIPNPTVHDEESPK